MLFRVSFSIFLYKARKYDNYNKNVLYLSNFDGLKLEKSEWGIFFIINFRVGIGEKAEKQTLQRAVTTTGVTMPQDKDESYLTNTNCSLSITSCNWIFYLSIVFIALGIAELIPACIDFNKFDLFLYMSLVTFLLAGVLLTTWHTVNLTLVGQPENYKEDYKTFVHGAENFKKTGNVVGASREHQLTVPERRTKSKESCQSSDTLSSLPVVYNNEAYCPIDNEIRVHQPAGASLSANCNKAGIKDAENYLVPPPVKTAASFSHPPVKRATTLNSNAFSLKSSITPYNNSVILLPPTYTDSQKLSIKDMVSTSKPKLEAPEKLAQIEKNGDSITKSSLVGQNLKKKQKSEKVRFSHKKIFEDRPSSQKNSSGISSVHPVPVYPDIQSSSKSTSNHVHGHAPLTQVNSLGAQSSTNTAFSRPIRLASRLTERLTDLSRHTDRSNASQLSKKELRDSHRESQEARFKNIYGSESSNRSSKNSISLRMKNNFNPDDVLGEENNLPSGSYNHYYENDGHLYDMEMLTKDIEEEQKKLRNARRNSNYEYSLVKGFWWVFSLDFFCN